ncbi:MAG: HutD family protein [Rhizobium sp.]|nr:HutD family protein [Rhizobium sp.]
MRAAGETVELAVFPPGASVGDFDWRISMASLVADGAFSLFPGDRPDPVHPVGEGLSLSVEGHQTVDLTPGTPPHFFSPDRPTSASLTAGPVADLNVMTRRGRFAHRVTRHQGRRFVLEPGQATR